MPKLPSSLRNVEIWRKHTLPIVHVHETAKYGLYSDQIEPAKISVALLSMSEEVRVYLRGGNLRHSQLSVSLSGFVIGV
jgi:hypothetical protein